MGCNNSKVYPYKTIDFNDYWIGPYGIQIPNTISKILDIDQCNFIIRPGNIRTNIPNNNKILNKEDYFNKYCLKGYNRKVLNLSDEILKECESYQIIVNNNGQKEYYKLMMNGETFIETTYYSKTIYPIHPVTKKPI